MARALLFVAELLEIAWAIGLKYIEGFTRPLPTALTAAAAIVSMVLLGLAAGELPIGTAYAVWTYAGAAGAFVLGKYLFAEPAIAVRIACVTLIVAGIVGLRPLAPEAAPAARCRSESRDLDAVSGDSAALGSLPQGGQQRHQDRQSPATEICSAAGLAWPPAEPLEHPTACVAGRRVVPDDLEDAQPC